MVHQPEVAKEDGIANVNKEAGDRKHESVKRVAERFEKVASNDSMESPSSCGFRERSKSIGHHLGSNVLTDGEDDSIKIGLPWASRQGPQGLEIRLLNANAIT